MEGENFNPEQRRKSSSGGVWVATTIIFAALLLVVLFTGFSFTGNVTKASAGKNFVNYINSQGGTQIEYINSTSFGSNLIQVNVLANGEGVPVFLTKDGRYFVQIISELNNEKPTVSQSKTTTPTAQVVKSAKPTVELFVMTYCPYGTQAEKGFIPAIKNLGSSVDAKIRFVHYFMHGDKEEAETYTQVCIREEQNVKYLDYLTCFLEDGNSTRCIKKIGIDQVKLDKCISSGKAKEYYASDSALSEGYGVQGSPTLVINGVEVSSGRDSASMLDSMCSAFTTAPSSCGASLSSTSPSPGFGTGTASSGSAAQCG